MDIVLNEDLVKREDVGNNICCSCLSQDRVLSPLNDHVELFMSLLGEQATSMEVERVLLCWECAAVLRRVSRFQWQVQYAQIFMQNMLSQDMSPNLSNLSIVRLENVDSTVCIETVSQNDSHIEKSKDEETKTVPMIKNEHETVDNKDIKHNILKAMEDDMDYDINFEDQNIEKSAPEMLIKQESRTDTDKKTNRKKVKTKYENKVKRTKNPDVDLNNISSCFTSSLTESDMESIGQDVEQRRKLEQHKKQSCFECKKLFRSVSILRKHKTFCHILKSKSQGPFNCLECSAPCADRTSLKAHWAQHKVAAKCKVCGEVVLWNSCMKTHAELHEYLWTCRLCKDFKAVYRSSKEYGHHYRALHRRAVCDYCGSRHKTKRALAHHISLKHLPPICAPCNKAFKDAHCLRRHTYYTHPASLAKRVDPDLAYCVECDRRFPSEFKYKLHLKTAVVHNPAAAWSRKSRVPCPECGKEFTRKSYMNNHRRQVHTKETKHYCQPCDKQYLVSAWSMKKHIEGVHQKIRQPRNKICDLCGRAFQTNAVLIKHIRTHTGERPYKCAHCPAAFSQSCALKSHARTQHKAM